MTELDETLTKDIVKRALTNKPKDKSHHDTQKKDPTDTHSLILSLLKIVIHVLIL